VSPLPFLFWVNNKLKTYKFDVANKSAVAGK
jgi:hypothetical protein